MLSSLTQHLRRIFGKQAAIMVETVRMTFELYNLFKWPRYLRVEENETEGKTISHKIVCVHVRSFERDSKNRLFSPPRSFYTTLRFNMGYV